MFDEPVFEWLTVCLGAQTNEVKTTSLDHLCDEDWSRVVELAAQYGVASLLYGKLRQLPGGLSVPKGIIERSRGAYLNTAAANMRIIHELGAIIAAFREAAIPVIALKGAYLAENVYPDIALRCIGSDLDLLVASGDLAPACAALERLAYHRSESDELESHWEAAKNITLHGPPGRSPIELHWTIEHPSDPVKIDLAGLWSRARPARVAGCEGLAFAPEDLLLHLCLEATYHHGNWFQMGLRPFCDILAIIQCAGERMDWEQIEIRAREWSAEQLVHLALWLAREWLAAPAPEEVLLSLRPEGFEENLESMARQLVFYQSLVPVTGSAMSWNIAQLGGPKPLTDKMRISFRAAFPSRDQIAAIYGVRTRSVLVYFCYLLHTMDLARRRGPAAWKLVFHRREAVVSARRINALIQLKERMRQKLSPRSACPER